MGRRLRENPFIQQVPEKSVCAPNAPLLRVRILANAKRRIRGGDRGKAPTPPNKCAKHLLGGGRTCPAEKKRHLLALICSIFRERRRRSNVLRINARAGKLRLKANYQVREREKNGNFQEI